MREGGRVLALAWRNVWRRRGRSLAVAGAVGAVVWLTLLYFGIVGGAGDGFYDRLTQQVGHLQVRVEGWRERRDFESLLIPGAAAVEAKVREALPAARVTPVLEVPALLSGESRSRGVLLVGQQPPAWLGSQRLAVGRWYAAGEPDAIVLGAALARALGVGIGDWVYAYAPGTLGLGAGALQVVGLLDHPDPSQEARAAYLPLEALQEMAAPGSVTRLEVRLDLHRLAEDGKLAAMRDAVAEQLGPGFAVPLWREIHPSFARLVDLLRPITAVVTALFFVMAGLLVLNNVYLSLMERIRELGAIVALGASRARLLALVVLESAALTLSGGAVGLVLGLASVAALSRGLRYPFVDLEQWGLPPVLYAALQPVDVAITVAFTVATALLAALWPGLVASRLQPVEAMRFRA